MYGRLRRRDDTTEEYNKPFAQRLDARIIEMARVVMHGRVEAPRARHDVHLQIEACKFGLHFERPHLQPRQCDRLLGHFVERQYHLKNGVLRRISFR